MMNLQTMVIGLKDNAVAKQLIQHWDYDKDSLQFWRASSNFVYQFKQNEHVCFLRFAHEQDRSYEHICAELQFMQYLQANDYPCVTPLPSKQGNLVESLHTSNGTYYAVAFSEADGEQLDIDEMVGLHAVKWGASLATLHELSQIYRPAHEQRGSWQDSLRFVRSILEQHPSEQAARTECDRIAQWLSELPVSSEQYGLIHYDFQQDNIFWAESDTRINAIDFDDSMYHWFGMDIMSATSDLREEDETGELFEAFLQGYRSVRPLDESIVDQFPRFARFANLYGFARVLYSLQDSVISDAPDWYDGLKEHLAELCDEDRVKFEQPWP
ncbi:phosphotransferase enzyme family protein [Paenibacillus sp. 481]|uniref:phosphotransferase enzyme family protein n=1 Tax=Paenibacillus sp. 481 TaxID=2835869 RepID=UPI001E460F28|nr:phosphotransferase [Paenibacillus sp. 481]UHA75504.1 phosphotransferase [Paenibacillus sp. 481]